jgi:hypothetical protein
MELVYAIKTSVNLYWTIWSRIPVDNNALQSHCCDTLQSNVADKYNLRSFLLHCIFLPLIPSPNTLLNTFLQAVFIPVLLFMVYLTMFHFIILLTILSCCSLMGNMCLWGHLAVCGSQFQRLNQLIVLSQKTVCTLRYWNPIQHPSSL